MTELSHIEYPPFFLECFDRLIGHEGKFQNNPKDRGNWTSGIVGVGINKGTKFGLSAMTYPHLDIVNISLEQAREIYYLDWWLKFGADYLQPAMIYQMWQFAINAGAGNARRCLQRMARVADDGHVGELTIAAIKKMDLNDMIMRFNAAVIRHYKKLGTWEEFGKGWMERVATNLDYGAEDN